MSYNLFLDDVRNPEDAWLYDENAKLIKLSRIYDWTVVRNYDEFVSTLQSLGLPHAVSFDHDLHFEHMRHYLNVTQLTGVFEYDNMKHKTGLACASYLTDLCRKMNTKLPAWYVHSANEVGRHNIKKFLRNFTETTYGTF